MLRFSGAGATHVGLVREHNEDSAFVGPYVALVADGVGGAAAGEVASATAAYLVSAHALASPEGDPAEVLTEAVRDASAVLRAEAARRPERNGMATTLTALVCDGAKVVLGHLGDSRCYLFRDGRLEQLSSDHTYVQAMVEAGRMTPAEARTHRWRNVVLRCLDSGPASEPDDVGVGGADTRPDLVAVPVEPGDRLLLCSDGLSDLVGPELISRALSLADAHSSSAVLVQLALDAGGTDNVTAVVLDVVDGPRVVGDGRVVGALVDPRNVVDPAAVRL
jgi:protein phosphatase